MKMITVTVNGKSYQTTEGKTILELVNEHKIDTIPTLCHDSRIEPYSSCFLCVVEVNNSNKLVPACSTKIADNMQINTNNQRVMSSRKTALALLLSNHYADCIGPCTDTCPAHVDAQGYIALLAAGDFEQALALIKQSNPLPLSIGRVCVRECENSCRRNLVDEAVAINNLKRYLADIDAKHKWMPNKKEPNGKHVAVIGGGPAGLTCAYFLNLQGYAVTIFDQKPKLGGMLRYGIPEYRLPKAILDDEINWILSQGITAKTSMSCGKDFTLESLKKQGFDAIFVSIGAQKGSTMNLEHENETQGILSGVDFLKDVQLNGIPALNGTVVVVGGGNTAIDAARTALRCGSKKVKIVYRRSRNEMPAHPAEIDAALHEGVEIEFLTNPKALIRKGSRINGVECIKMQLVESKPGEKPKPVPIPNSEITLQCDYLISAIGQQIDSSVTDSLHCRMERNGTIVINKDTYETSVPGLFAGGDTVSGPWIAISAIAHGKFAAYSIDSYIQTGKAAAMPQKFYSFKHSFDEVNKSEFDFVEKSKRNNLPEIPLHERKESFHEVELGLTSEQSHCESKRCLECGCSKYADCMLRIYADEYKVSVSPYKGEVKKYKVDRRHPLITIDSNKCIQCGRCVRTCTSILNGSALGFVYRGFQCTVQPALGKALNQTNCISCGNCIDTCPTGALTENSLFKVMGTAQKTDHETICNFCSIGCHINIKKINDSLYYVSNATEEIRKSHNKGYACSKGRFGYRYLLESKNRLTTPLMKIDHVQQKIKWEDAVISLSQNLTKIISNYGPESVAVFGSPKMTNEQLYLLQKFARTVLKTNNIGSFSHLFNQSTHDTIDDSVGLTVSTVQQHDCAHADVIVIANTELCDEHLILELKIKEAQKNGAKIVSVSSHENRLSRYADLHLDTIRGTNTALFNGLIHEMLQSGSKINSALEQQIDGVTAVKETVSPFNAAKVTSLTGIDSSKYEEFISLVKDNSKKVIFIYNIDSMKEKSRNDLQSITNFLLITGRMNSVGSGLLLVRDHANGTGLVEMGVSTHYLPGLVRYHEKEQISRIGKQWGVNLETLFVQTDLLDKMLQTEIKAAFIVGEDPFVEPNLIKYLRGVEYLAVCDLFSTHTSREADLVLPLNSFLETEGSYTSCDRIVRYCKPILKPKSEVSFEEFMTHVAHTMGMWKDSPSVQQIHEEIQRINRLHPSNSSKINGQNHVFSGGYFTPSQRAVLSDYSIECAANETMKQNLMYSDYYYHSRIRS